MRYIAWILLVVFLLSQSIAANQIAQSQNASQKPAQDSDSDAEHLAKKRMEVLLRVRSFVDRVFEFQDLEARTLNLIRLADRIWEYDEPYARQIFIKTYDSLKSLAPAEGQDETLSPESKKIKGQLAFLSSVLISSLTKHDAALAGKLPIIGGGTKAATALKALELNSALRLLKAEDGTAKAIEISERAMQGDTLSNSSMIVFFLLELRNKDEEAANRLFLMALQNLAAQPVVDAMNLMRLGTYIFTDPRAPSHTEPSIRYTKIGKIMVVSLSADRPNIPPAIIRAYLNAAIEIMSRPITDARQKSYYYAMGHQLVPKVERFVPEQLPRLRLIMSSLLPDVSQELTQPSTYAPLERTNTEFDSTGVTYGIEKMPDERLREEAYFSVSHSLYYHGDIAGAREMAERIKNLTVRNKVLNSISYTEVIKALERGNISLAEEMASKLTPGSENALAWLEVGHAYAEKKDSQKATQALNTAVKAADSVDDSKRPFIFLIAASELAGFDWIEAQSILGHAVRTINSGESKLGMWSQLWDQEIEIGGLSRKFRLPRKGINNNFLSNFEKLAAVNIQQTEETALSLKHEKMAGEAIVALASIVLREIKVAKAK